MGDYFGHIPVFVAPIFPRQQSKCRLILVSIDLKDTFFSKLSVVEHLVMPVLAKGSLVLSLEPV